MLPLVTGYAGKFPRPACCAPRKQLGSRFEKQLLIFFYAVVVIKTIRPRPFDWCEEPHEATTTHERCLHDSNQRPDSLQPIKQLKYIDNNVNICDI